MRLILLGTVALTVVACGGGNRGRGNRDAGPGGGDTGTRSDAAPPGGADDITRAGVIWGSCVPDDGIADFVTEAWDGDADVAGLDALIACIASAGGGCEALETCVGVTVDLTGPCATSCTGATWSGCDDMLHFSIDCSRIGMTCHVDEGCIAGTPEPCDPDRFVNRCEDGRPVYCGSVVRRGPVCADHGTTCAPDGFGGYACQGTGGACSSTFTSPGSVTWSDGVRCDGDILTACVNGGLATRDCATVGPGFHCQTTGTRTFCGLGAECDPFDSRSSTCTGTSVQFCNMGRLETVDCTTLGFTGCNPTYGVCTPTGFAP